MVALLEEQQELLQQPQRQLHCKAWRLSEKQLVGKRLLGCLLL
jgi:hypothetical protein